MICYIEKDREVDKNQLVNMGVIKPTSENASKQLSIRQETGEMTRTSKTTETILKQIATR